MALLLAGLSICTPHPTLAAPASFVHPGVLNNRFELEYMKARVNAGAQPWKSAFDKLKTEGVASLNHKPAPRAVVECGSYNNPDRGCTDEREDSRAAVAHALQWVVTGDEKHALKAVEILDGWSAVLKNHTNSNAPLQSAWTGGPFLQAAEIIRHTYPKWSTAQIARFSQMMNQAYLPHIRPGTPLSGTSSMKNGNWEAAMIEAMLALAVFDENGELWDHAVAMFKKRLPAYIYASVDGPIPLAADPKFSKDGLIRYWHRQSAFMDGLCQETCRDLGHTQQGFGSLAHACEIAWKQGVDLYGENQNRLHLGMEFQAKFMLGEKPPSNLCGGRVTNTAFIPTWEMVYNHYRNWKKLPMPNAEKLLEKNRPEGSLIHLFYGTLTHHGMGAAGQTWPPVGTAILIAREGRLTRINASTDAGFRTPGYDLSGRRLEILKASAFQTRFFPDLSERSGRSAP